MPPQLALILTTGFCLLMLVRFARDPRETSVALWLPVIWIFFAGSRFPSQWMEIFGIRLGGGALEDGSPLDAVVFLLLIMAGSAVVLQRSLDLPALIRGNVCLIVFFAYGFLAIVWSDFPFVAFKRWIKTLGHPIMALIILTSPDPKLAFRLVLKRCAFIMLPLSVMFIKYFPQYGRGFDPWSGAATNGGIALNKNELGYSCFIFGIFFVWNYLLARRMDDTAAKKRETYISIGFLVMIVWLLRMAQSATSIVVLTVGAATIIGLGLRFISKRRFGTVVIVAVLVAVAAELSIGVYALTLELLGRDPTLTDRTAVWADAISLADSSVLGAGFESFWLGPRLEAMWEKWWWRPTQAHNGYIETYLNLGFVGLLLLVILLIATFRKITKSFFTDFDFARLRMAFLFAVIFYNYSETSFKATHFLWTIFYIIALDLPRTAWAPDADETPHDPEAEWEPDQSVA